MRIRPFSQCFFRPRNFCSSSTPSSSSSSSSPAPVLLRRDHFEPARRHALAPNERSVFASRGRPIEPGRDSATLVLIVQEAEPEEQSWILLTQRCKKMSSHANEIALPGGRIDQGETIEQAALREAEEEIGLEPRALDLWGAFRPLNLRNLEGTVTPMVASISGDDRWLSALKCADGEVQNIFLASVGDLLSRIRYTAFRTSPATLSPSGWPFHYRLPVFHPLRPRVLCRSSPVADPSAHPPHIWGLTALMLLETLHAALPEDAEVLRGMSPLLRTDGAG